MAKELLRQVERAYRRGFQQGHHFANHTINPPTDEQVFNFRYVTTLKKDYGAPENYNQGKPPPIYGNLYDRFRCECDNDTAIQLAEYIKKLIEK